MNHFYDPNNVVAMESHHIDLGRCAACGAETVTAHFYGRQDPKRAYQICRHCDGRLYSIAEYNHIELWKRGFVDDIVDVKDLARQLDLI